MWTYSSAGTTVQVKNQPPGLMSDLLVREREGSDTEMETEKCFVC